MKKIYNKPVLEICQVCDTPILGASYGNGYADKDGTVLTKEQFSDDDEFFSNPIWDE